MIDECNFKMNDQIIEKVTLLKFLINTWNNFISMLVDFIVISFYYFLLKFKYDKVLVASFGFGLTYLSFSMSFLYGFCELLGIYLA